MKKNLLRSTILIALLNMMGCVNNAQGEQQRGYYGGGYHNQPITNNTPIQRSSTPQGSINNQVKSSLAYMYEEERLAKEVYEAIYRHQPLRQLTQIASRSEVRHIDAVRTLAQRYGVATSPQQAGRYQISHIQSLYDQLYRKGIRSQKDALEVGCMVEVTDIDDLNRYIAEAQRANAQDVIETYDFLRKGSYNHYWSFDRGLKQIGISQGCCSLGSKYCHPEYPQKEQGGHGRGQGRGQGQGHGMGQGRW